jgi:hypothetical protein
MLKGYVIGWKERPTERHTQVDVYFDHRPEKVYSRETREGAELDCRYLDSLDIRVGSAEGEAQLCAGFKAEERAPNQFVVFCAYPLVRTHSGWVTPTASDPSDNE